MRGVVLTGSFPFPRAGGSVEYVTNIFGAFPPRTLEIHAAAADNTEAFDAAYPQRVVRHSYVIHVVDGYRASRTRRLAQYLCWPAAAFWAIVSRRPEVVYLGEYNPAGIGALLASYLGLAPYILLTYAEEVTYVQRSPTHARLFGLIARRAAAVITVSEYTSTVLQSMGVERACIHKILPSVPAAKHGSDRAAGEAIRRRLGLGNDPVLLTVGRLIERKGHLTAIQALAQVRESHPTARYVIVGRGPMQARLEEAARQLPDDAVVMLTDAGDDDVSALYDACDVFLMPHRSIPETGDTEGCPTVFLEASAHGKPTVGGNSGGVADAILDAETGFIVDGTDPEAVARVVISLFDDPLLARRLGARGVAYAAELTPACAAAALLEVTERVVGAPARAPRAAVHG